MQGEGGVVWCAQLVLNCLYLCLCRISPCTAAEDAAVAVEGKAQDTRRQLYIGIVYAAWVGDPLGFLRRGCFQSPCLAALPIRLLGGEDAVTVGEVAGVALHCGAVLTDIPTAEVPRGLDSPALFTGSA